MAKFSMDENMDDFLNLSNSIKAGTLSDPGFELEVKGEHEIIKLPIDTLVDYHNHIFKEQSKEKLDDLACSIRENGIVQPLIVRPIADGGFEIISGHTRRKVAKQCGLEEVPCIVMDLDDESADELMVVTNIQRENQCVSEKAWGYNIRMDAISHRGKKIDNTGRKSADIVGEAFGDTGKTVQRYIKLTNLIPEFLDMCDNKKMSPFTVGIELADLTADEQKSINNFLKVSSTGITSAQAKALKKKHIELAKENKILDDDIISDILSVEEKTGTKKAVTLSKEIRDFFDEDATNEDIENTIIDLLKKWKEERK